MFWQLGAAAWTLGRLGLVLSGLICLRPSSSLVPSFLLPLPASDFLLHLVGRYTISHRPLNSGVQQRHQRHGGPWTFQQASAPACPSDCGWFCPCPGTERMQLLRGESRCAGGDRAGGPGADPPHRPGRVLPGPALPSGARGCRGGDPEAAHQRDRVTLSGAPRSEVRCLQ